MGARFLQSLGALFLLSVITNIDGLDMLRKWLYFLLVALRAKASVIPKSTRY